MITVKCNDANHLRQAMRSMSNTVDDINKLVASLDITPTMYYDARQKYRLIAKELMQIGIESLIYPQGSFQLGTIVRPYNKGLDKEFDLDIVCELSYQKEISEPERIKNDVGILLKESANYSGFLQPEEDRCWVLLYQKSNFKLDIVPSVHQTDEVIAQLIQNGVLPAYAAQAIAITHKNKNNSYKWADSNPQGYADWFKEINEPYINLTIEENRGKILNENKMIFSKIEDIPEILDRSALQRVIQILKRHRDVFFANASVADEKIWDYRPISAIITTLCGRIARSTAPTGSILELLNLVAHELRDHAVLQGESDSMLFEASRKSTYIRKTDNKWKIKNPVNPEDNYTDYWTSAHAQWFFRWLDVVYKDFFVDLDINEEKRHSVYRSAFGSDYANSVIPEPQIKPPVIIKEGTQPYRCNR